MQASSNKNAWINDFCVIIFNLSIIVAVHVIFIIYPIFTFLYNLKDILLISNLFDSNVYLKYN